MSQVWIPMKTTIQQMITRAKLLRAVCTALLLCTTLVVAVQNIKVQGADFVNNVTSNRLQIIGVAYVPDPAPPPRDLSSG